MQQSQNRLELTPQGPRSEKSLVSLEDKKAFIKQCLEMYSPDRQCEICTTPLKAVACSSPTLKSINERYGMATARLVVIPHITDFLSFAASKSTIEETAIISIANIIVANYGFMKVSEIMLFFFRFKSGLLGNTYGAITPMDITCKLNSFRTYLGDLRNMERMQEEARQRDRRASECSPLNHQNLHLNETIAKIARSKTFR